MKNFPSTKLILSYVFAVLVFGGLYAFGASLFALSVGAFALLGVQTGALLRYALSIEGFAGIVAMQWALLLTVVPLGVLILISIFGAATFWLFLVALLPLLLMLLLSVRRR